MPVSDLKQAMYEEIYSTQATQDDWTCPFKYLFDFWQRTLLLVSNKFVVASDLVKFREKQKEKMQYAGKTANNSFKCF